MSILLFSILLIVLTFIAVMLVSGNNMSVCVGSAVGSRVISKRFGIFLGAAGLSTGLLLQGSTMTNTITILFPSGSIELRVAALFVATIIFIMANIVRVPMSLSMSLVGLLAGLSIGENSMGISTFALEVIAMWFSAPLISIVLAFLIIRLLKRGWPKDFWQRILIYKVLLIILSFTTAFVLGANTLGLLVATGGFDSITVGSSVIGIFIGSIFFSSGALKRISQEFYSLRYLNSLTTLIASTVLVEIATFINIPLSNTQTTASAIFGVGMSYRTKFISAKPFLIIVVSWIIAPLSSFVIGFILNMW